MGYVHIDDKYEPYLDLIIDCIKVKGEDIDKVVKEFTDDTSLMTDCLEENLIQFKYHGQRIRDEYKKVTNEQIKKNTELFEECDKLLQESEPTIKHIKRNLESIGYLIDSLNKKLDIELGVNLNKIERLLQIVQEINSMPATDKELLRKVLTVD